MGDEIRSLEGDYGTVTVVEISAADQWMYNLTVDEAHTFFVGDEGWLVHNIDYLFYRGTYLPEQVSLYRSTGMLLADSIVNEHMLNTEQGMDGYASMLLAWQKARSDHNFYLRKYRDLWSYGKKHTSEKGKLYVSDGTTKVFPTLISMTSDPFVALHFATEGADRFDWAVPTVFTVRLNYLPEVATGRTVTPTSGAEVFRPATNYYSEKESAAILAIKYESALDAEQFRKTCS